MEGNFVPLLPPRSAMETKEVAGDVEEEEEEEEEEEVV